MEVKEPKYEWGGPWTEKKLDAFSKYVHSYLTIMKNFPYWETIYFDGFVGSGERNKVKSELYEQLSIDIEEEKVYEGSAERIIKIQDKLKFNYYYFIDTRKKSLNVLEERLRALPESANKTLEFRNGDANKYLLELSKALNTKKPAFAALILLDPFGMQIEWSSIESLKRTRSDIWILIPTGVIVNRLLDKKGKLKSLKKLVTFFGLVEEDIRSHFYNKQVQQSFFGEEEAITKVRQPIEKIADLYIQRLKTVWKFVIPQPLRLNNSKGAPIFHFVFASNNANAVKIAKQIISKP